MWCCAAALNEMNSYRQHPSHLIQGELSWEWQVTRDHSYTLSWEQTWGLLKLVKTKHPHMMIYFHRDTLFLTVKEQLTLNNWENTKYTYITEKHAHLRWNSPVSCKFTCANTFELCSLPTSTFWFFNPWSVMLSQCKEVERKMFNLLYGCTLETEWWLLMRNDVSLFFHPEGDRNFCISNHSFTIHPPSNNCWDISVWIKVVV